MKELMENWRRFLENQEVGPQKYKLYCDMDGVLVDFEKGALEYMNRRFQEIASNKDELARLEPDRSNPDYNEFKAAKKAAEELGGWDVEIAEEHIAKPADGGRGYKKVRDFMYRLVANNREFWATLPWIDGGRELWNYIKDFQPEILTAPMGPASERGKEDWCARELGAAPVNIASDKSPFGHGDGKRVPLLIDDREKYRKQFESTGGETVAHTPGEAGPTIEKLKQLGLSPEDEQNEVEFSGILKLKLSNSTLNDLKPYQNALPADAIQLPEERLHVTLIHQSVLRPFRKQIKAAGDNPPWSQIPVPEVKLSSEVRHVLDGERESWAIMIENQQDFKNYVLEVMKSLGAEPTDPEPDRHFHITLANKTGNPGDSVALVEGENRG